MKPLSIPLKRLTCTVWLAITWPVVIAQDHAALQVALLQDQQVPDERKLVDIIALLQEHYQVSFLYDKMLIKGQATAVQLDLKAGIESNLKKIFHRTSTLTYQKIDLQTYIILKKDRKDPLINMLDPIPAQDKNKNGAPGFNRQFKSYLNKDRQYRSTRRTAEKTISGKVTEAGSNTPIPGVNILVKGTNTGSVTGIDGSYTLVAPDDATVLIFSSVGYVSQEVMINGQSIINVAMLPDVTQLGEIVVTALGIRKESRKVGYATSNVDAREITENRSPNFINALQGKVAGVNISALGTGPAGTSKIRIRGQSSIAGQNNPLIVINGVPIDNTNFGTNPRNEASDSSIGVRSGGGNTSDGGDGLSSINPDDIESMTILKGATAAALYGSRAKDGVIMITTKTRGDGEGIAITYNINYTNESPLDFTDYQYEYGQGENGVRPTSPNPTSGQWSFGERFQPGMTQVLFDNLVLPYAPVRDRVKKFYRNGQNVTNTVTLSSGGEKGGFNLSLSNLKSRGIVPNHTFSRKTVNLGLTHNFNEKFNISANVNYSNEYNRNPPNVAQQDNTIPVTISNLANSMPLEVLEANAFNEAGDEYVYSRFRNRTNPYFTLQRQFQNIRRDRIFGNIALKYNLLPWLTVQGRIGQDYWSRDQDYNNYPTGQASRPPAPSGFSNGIYTQESRRFREINADFLVTANRELGDFGVDLSFGGNHMYRRSDLNSVQVTDFVIRDLYTVQNGRVKDPLYQLRERGVNSLYGSAELSYKGLLYLNGTLRNDWFSTLSPKNRSILYPSISLSYVFSESLKNLPSWLSFGKLRLAYADVGSDSDVQEYSDVLFYSINANFLANGSGNPQPLGNITGNTVPNLDLRPMRASETEIGLELKMFEGRVNLDIAAYQKLTRDQIVSAEISDGSGFTNTLINSGESRNRGVEMLLHVIPYESADFTWDFTFNSAYNKTKVLSLLTDTPGDRITVGRHVFNGELRQIVGSEIAQLAGFGYLRDDQGRQVFGANGVALRTPEIISFGSALPTWVGGFTNAFTYKELSFSFLIDFKLGNKMMSGTNFNAVRHGLHKITLDGREGGVVGDGVNEQGELNTVAAEVQRYWEVVRSQQLVEPIVYNGGFWKLRQITVGYNLTKLLPERFPVKAARLSLVANNVLILKKWIPNIDPETFGFSSDNLAGLESTGLPSTRGLGFNLNVKF
ncbi:SusC/RagA family TonB-linked outer membrane protein [Fulvivirgaceae bacterium BMA12]|uniref:SusC/RagA family TonB-linked outer membrane protein n=1 Tax=Agaribacillus aureus TaxID=3051825 RepID=A0ABT8LA95_9BACT|nr:SusC/RagA family TonB-linked outer membrane protein [Fulvivirgaceae bacterium BMA12]